MCRLSTICKFSGYNDRTEPHNAGVDQIATEAPGRIILVKIDYVIEEKCERRRA